MLLGLHPNLNISVCFKTIQKRTYPRASGKLVLDIVALKYQPGLNDRPVQTSWKKPYRNALGVRMKTRDCILWSILQIDSRWKYRLSNIDDVLIYDPLEFAPLDHVMQEEKSLKRQCDSKTISLHQNTNSLALLKIPRLCHQLFFFVERNSDSSSSMKA